MQLHMYLIFITGLIPLITGFIWYNPKVFGNAWMKSIGATEESLKGSNMALIFGFCYVFGVLISVGMMPIVIHQMSMMFSMFADDPTAQDPTSKTGMYLKAFYDNNGLKFRTFKHGAFHGILSSVFIALPILGTNALFERRGFKYILIHVGYWALTLALIGGVLCQFM